MGKKKKNKKRQRKTDSTTSYGGLQSGGFQNDLTGAGGLYDKSEYSYFLPTLLTSRQQLETLYVQSWAAKKFIDIPIDDMFLKWRVFSDMTDESVELMEAVEKEFDIQSHLSRGIKAGNLYGTGLVIMLTKEAPPEKPLNVDRMVAGDLLNLLTVDRFDCTVVSKDWDLKSLNYGNPELYKVTLKQGGTLTVHHSRVLRFDGMLPLSQVGWTLYDPDWGVSTIIPVLKEIMTDSGISSNVAHLVAEASIKIQKIEDYASAITGDGDCEISLEERQRQTTLGISNYKTLYMGTDDDFVRTEITFAGLPNILDRSAKRLAAAANIPATRFWGQSPLGLNATGDSDMKNHAIQVDSEKNKKLPEPLNRLDPVLAKHAGVTEPINYDFPSLIDVSESEQADVLVKKLSAITPAAQTGLISEEEARAALDGDPILGNLDLSGGGLLPEVAAFQARAAEASKQAEIDARKQMDGKKRRWWRIGG